MITYGSVCSGIESASVAWEPLGMKPLWFSEIEPFPCKVLDHHWPTVPNLGDMTVIPDAIRMGLFEAPDVLVGGTPCQAFSVAGKQMSLDDARGQLTLVYGDLLNAIDEVRDIPAIAVWENVPGVLSTKDNAFGWFLGLLAGEFTLADCLSGTVQPLEAQPGESRQKWPKSGCVIGPRRTVAWRVLDAQYFGVAQRRNRVFVVASARNGFDPAEVLFEREGVRRDIAPISTPYPTIDCGIWRKRQSNQWTNNGFAIVRAGKVSNPTILEVERLQGFPDGHTAIPGAADSGRYKALGNSKAVPVVQWIGVRILCHLL